MEMDCAMNAKEMMKVAKLEIGEWKSAKIPKGLAFAILFAFIHRITTGKSVEETFFPNQKQQPDYEI